MTEVLVDFALPVWDSNLEEIYRHIDFDYFRKNNPAILSHFAWGRHSTNKEYAEYLKLKYPTLIKIVNG